MRCRVGWIEGQGLAKAVDRFVEFAGILEHVAEVVVQGGMAGVELQAAAQNHFGLVEAAQRAQQATESCSMRPTESGCARIAASYAAPWRA